MEDARFGVKQAYIIVCGNEKGGSGKTTTSMHIAVSLMSAGYKVATIDLDTRQLSLTRYVENRKNHAKINSVSLTHSEHFNLERTHSDSVVENENSDLNLFSNIIQDIENHFDFIVIDTPGHDSYLMRLAHSMADTLVTPLNDSFIDFDVLGRADFHTGELTEISHYANMVRDARRHRRNVDGGLLDWVVVRNRMAQLVSRNSSRVEESLKNLAMKLGCRLATGIAERVVYREFFLTGLTALDDLDGQVPKSRSISHLAARQEVRALINALRLPIDHAGIERAQARKSWMATADKQTKKFKVFAE